MKTDWQLIRETMNSVIDACESIEILNISEDERTCLLAASPANVWDALQSSWTYPENVRYEIIRNRHELGDDSHFTSEAARALVNTAEACAELIGAGEAQPIQQPVKNLSQWYVAHLVPQVTNAIEAKRKSSVELTENACREVRSISTVPCRE